MKTVLLVDDEPIVRSLVSEAFQQVGGYRVVIADDGPSALTAAWTYRPDLVLLDIMMPILDGLGVCKALRQDPRTRNTKIIMLTALNQHATRTSARELGADGFLAKPFHVKDLLAEVDNLTAERWRIGA